MTELLEHEAPWKGKSELPHGEHSSNTDASQPGNHTAKVLPIWPTPTADAWAKKSKIALRVFTTLHWLHSKIQLKLQQHDSSYGAACTGLNQQLALLLHRLLTDHLADAQLDMTDFLGCGITSIPLMLESNQPQYPPLTSFAESCLNRPATYQYALANLSIVSPAYGEGTWADTQGMLSLWRVVCKQANKPALHSTVDAALEALHAHASQQQAAQLWCKTCPLLSRVSRVITLDK